MEGKQREDDGCGGGTSRRHRILFRRVSKAHEVDSMGETSSFCRNRSHREGKGKTGKVAYSKWFFHLKCSHQWEVMASTSL